MISKTIMQKQLAKLLSVALISILMLGLFVTPVKADGSVTRTQTVCDSGSYGAQNCHEVVTTIPTHSATKVNTGIADFNVAIFAVAAVLILSTVSYIRIK